MRELFRSFEMGFVQTFFHEQNSKMYKLATIERVFGVNWDFV